MQQAEEYRARAEHAERQATLARDERERQAYLEIAHLWRGLAGERLTILSQGLIPPGPGGLADA